MARKCYRRRRSSDSSQIFIVLIVLLGLGGVLARYSFLSDVNIFIGVIILAVIIVLLGTGIIVYFSLKEKKRKRAITLSQVDTMTGVEFEQYLGDLLKSQNYKVRYTPVSGDYGTDIIAEKNGKRFSIQAKRYKEKVGPAAVQQAYAALRVYKCDQAIVITNSHFTKEAIQLAKYNDCLLVDRDELTDWIMKFQKSTPRMLG